MDTLSSSSRVHAAVELLRARGERVTSARMAVLEVLASTRGHLNAEEIVARAGERAPGVHRATVYRALSTLGQLDLVTHTHVGGSAAVYHLGVAAPSSGETNATHAHLQCTVCNTVIDVPIAALDALGTQLERDLGFRLHPEHAALLGVCADCR